MGLACRAEELPCARIGELCTGDTWFRGVAAVVDDAVAVDVDGDGEDEIVALTQGSFQLALGYRDGARSVVWLKERPVALARVGREVAVALSEGPGVAIFGADADGRLERRRDLAVKYDANDLWSGELDGDAGTELIVVHPNGRLTVLEAESGKRREISIGGEPTAVAVGDLDADKVVDVVVADPGRSAVHVLRGAGGGELHPARKFLAIENMDALVLADGDGDGDVDVLTRNMGRPGVVVLHNNGKGELSLPLELEFTELLPSGRGLAVGPASAEGVAGISVPQDDRLATWLREGTGWLGHVEDLAYGNATWIHGMAGKMLLGGEGYVLPYVYREAMTPVEIWHDASAEGDFGSGAIAVGDLDGDGLIDVVTAGGAGMNVFFGTATGLTKTATVQLGIVPTSMEVVELTGDGRADILFGDGESVGVVQAGVNGFTRRPLHTPAIPPRRLVTLRTGAGAPAVVAAAPSDFQVLNMVPGVALLRHGGDGAVADESILADSLTVGGLVAVDADGDGVDEVALYAKRGDTPEFIRMTPSGSGFEPGPEFDLSQFLTIRPHVVNMAAGTPNLDGTPEVWISGIQTVRVFDLAAEEPTIVGFQHSDYADRFRDIDGDGHLDAVSVSTIGYIFYRRGHGDGTFDAESLSFNIPGGPELALTSGPGGRFDVATSSRTWTATHSLHSVTRPIPADDTFDFHAWAAELEIGDVDGDGRDDVVTVSDGRKGGVQVLWGDPTGSLARADGVNKFSSNRGLALGDIDGDGTIEVVASNDLSFIEAYRFSPRAELVPTPLQDDVLAGVRDIEVADVDADGRADLFALDYAQFQDVPGTRLLVAYGEGPEFSDWEVVVQLPDIDDGKMQVGDVDGDGSIDVLVRQALTAGVLVLADGPRAWGEPIVLPGRGSRLVPRGDEGRVDLWIHDGDTIARHPDGDLERREVVLKHQDLADGFLRRVVDIDGDGQNDITVARQVGFDVWLRGDDGYQKATHVDDMQTVEVGDVDGDGRPDLVGLTNGNVAVRLAAKRE